MEPYYHSVNTIPAEIRTLDSLVRDNIVLSKKVDTLEILINRQFNVIHKILSLKNSGPITSEEEALVLAGRNNMNEIRSIIKRIAEVENRIFEIRLSSETDFRNIAPLALLLFTLTALIGVSLLFSKINDALDKQRIAEARLNENILALKSEVGIREFTQKTLRNVLDNSLDGIMAFRAKRNQESRAIEGFELILSNAIASKSTGKSESELIGKQLQSIFPIESEDLFDTFKEVVQTGQPAQFEKLISG